MKIHCSYNQSGQILLLVIVTLGVVLSSSLALIGGAQVYYSNSNYSVQAEKATALAEAGIDKALASLNKTGGSYLGESEVFLEDGSFAVTVTTKDVGTKVIESIGYIPNKAKAKVKRTVKMESSKGTGVAFVYGIQVGEGGLILGNSNTILGSVYANGNIVAGNGNVITGDAWVAGGLAPNADQESECLENNCIDYLFGKNVDGEIRQDVGQSFQLSKTTYLNKVSLRIKKIGNPGDATVRVLRDNGSGHPDKNGVIASGTLYSSLVSNNYGWIDVTFTTIPQLAINTTYWLVVNSVISNSNYWSWQNDLAQSYTVGSPKWCYDWQKCKTWSSISGDLNFKAYVGGMPTSIQSINGGNNLVVQGNVHANTIQNVTINKDAYFQTLVDSTVAGTKYPGSADPPPKVFPVSDANITFWKSEAEKAGIVTGDITVCPATLGPKKIEGNINIGSNCTITIKSPIWVTGNLTLNSNNTIKLDDLYGSTSGVIIVDGKIDLNTNNLIQGTGTGSSLLMVLSTFDSKTNGQAAIAINGNGNTGVFYAKDGIIEPGSNNRYKELTAWGIRLVSASTIDYESGLSSTLFSEGPGGSYSLVKGTYQVK